MNRSATNTLSHRVYKGTKTLPNQRRLLSPFRKLLCLEVSKGSYSIYLGRAPGTSPKWLTSPNYDSSNYIFKNNIAKLTVTDKGLRI